MGVEIVSQSGVKGGFVVHVGCGDGVLTAQLRAGSRYVVRGLDRDADCVRTAREHVQSQGLYGTISVALLEGERLPPIDNLVDLLVVSASDPAVTGPEVHRVLTPLGVAMVKGGLAANDGLQLRGEALGFTMYAKPWRSRTDVCMYRCATAVFVAWRDHDLFVQWQSLSCLTG